MKPLNFIRPLFFLFILTVLFSACKKDKIFTIQGNWLGSYTDQALTEYPFAIAIYSENNVNKVDLRDETDINDNLTNTITAKGTWTLEGDIITLDVTYLILGKAHLLFVGKFDKQTGKITTGTWRFYLDNTVSGIWHMDKQ